MKQNAIARIIIFSLLVIILSGVLIAGICLNIFSWSNVSIGTSVGSSLSDGTESASESFAAADIDEIVVIWVSGNVNISGGEDATISYETKKNHSNWETVYKLENRRLTIGFSGKTWNTGKVKSKDLILSLPQNWEGKLVKVEGVSADFTIQMLSNIQQLKIENVSGKNTVQSVIANKLDVETVSGDMTFNGR